MCTFWLSSNQTVFPKEKTSFLVKEELQEVHGLPQRGIEKSLCSCKTQSQRKQSDQGGKCSLLPQEIFRSYIVLLSF